MAKAIDRPDVLDALKAIRAEAHRLEQEPGYHYASVEGLTAELGFDHIREDILEACMDGGFTYCLTGPARDWGADQLRSRLDCVDYRLWTRYPHAS